LIDRVKSAGKSRSIDEKSRVRASKRRTVKRPVQPVVKKPRERSIPLRP
jgi:hypothetical protein